MAFPLLFRRYFVVNGGVSLKKSTSSGFAAIWCIKNVLIQMFCECVGWHSYEKNHNSIMFVWGLFLYITHRTQAWQKICCKAHIKKPPLAHQEEQTTTRIVVWYGVRGLDGGPTFQKLFWIRSPYYHPAKVEHCHCLAIQDGSDQWKPTQGRVAKMGSQRLQVNLSEIRTTHYGGYHRRWLGFGKSGWLRRE